MWEILDQQYGSQYPLYLHSENAPLYHDSSPSKSTGQSDDEIIQKDPSFPSSKVSVSIPSPPSFPSLFPDHLYRFQQSSVSSVHPCVVCGEDAILCCSRCKRCFYCSLTCRDVHIPYHRYTCEQLPAADRTPMLSAPLQQPSSLMRQGIFNSGNTCYLASALQCLFSVTPLRSLLVGKHYLRYIRSDVGSPVFGHV